MSQIVAVQGVDFLNKGAELMLRTIIQNLGNQGLTVAADLRCGSFRQRADLQLHHLPWLLVGRLTPRGSVTVQESIDAASRIIIPRKVRQYLNIACENDVSAILDASGFRYSDQNGLAGEKITEVTAYNVARWRKKGKQVIFLPQAFGPFNRKGMRESVSRIIDNASIIFARDTVSFEYLQNLSAGSQNVRIAPDFTCLASGICPDYFNAELKRPCIIPNSRMISTTAEDVGASYRSFLSSSISYLREQGQDPFILIHEGNDMGLAQEIQKILPGSVEIVQETNPLYIKGILGQCSFVISSRYHGLINALSQGVPCVATSWSHKYQMLLEDYDCSDCLISLPASEDTIRDQIDRVSLNPRREDLLARLRKASYMQQQLALDMWNEVYKIMSVGQQCG